MDVQDAVSIAKNWIRNLYADEDISNVGLEEVRLNQGSDTWQITVGFSRPWDARQGILAATPGAPVHRSFKTVNIDDKSRNVISLESREVVQAFR